MIYIAYATSNSCTDCGSSSSSSSCIISSISSSRQNKHNEQSLSCSKRVVSRLSRLFGVGMVLLMVSQQPLVTVAWTTLPATSFTDSSTRQNGGVSFVATVGVQLQSLRSPFRLVQHQLHMTESSSPTENANGEKDINNGEAVDFDVTNDNDTNEVNTDKVNEITASSQDEVSVEEATVPDEAAVLDNAAAAEVAALKDEIAALESSLKAQRRKVMQVSDEADEYTKSGYARQVAAMENMRRARSVRDYRDYSKSSSSGGGGTGISIEYLSHTHCVCCR
jgi:hypothetical protein